MLYGKHINEHIGISNEDLKQLTSFTLDYLNDPDASLDIQMNVNGKIREIYTDDEKIHMCEVVNKSDAEYIKTSTGFSTGGATFDDVQLMVDHMNPGKLVKAAGGIADLNDADKF